MRHMLILVLRVTHRLHPRGLELSMFAMRIWQCIDYLHLHLLCFSVGGVLCSRACTVDADKLYITISALRGWHSLCSKKSRSQVRTHQMITSKLNIVSQLGSCTLRMSRRRSIYMHVRHGQTFDPVCGEGRFGPYM
jgi:hypothetical protein